MDFDISYVVERRVGEKIHEHYRIKLTAEERSAFDTKIPNVEAKEEVIEHLKKPVGLTKDDFATIGAVFLNAS